MWRVWHVGCIRSALLWGFCFSSRTWCKFPLGMACDYKTTPWFCQSSLVGWGLIRPISCYGWGRAGLWGAPVVLALCVCFIKTLRAPAAGWGPGCVLLFFSNDDRVTPVVPFPWFPAPVTTSPHFTTTRIGLIYMLLGLIFIRLRFKKYCSRMPALRQPPPGQKAFWGRMYVYFLIPTARRIFFGTSLLELCSEPTNT